MEKEARKRIDKITDLIIVGGLMVVSGAPEGVCRPMWDDIKMRVKVVGKKKIDRQNDSDKINYDEK